METVFIFPIDGAREPSVGFSFVRSYARKIEHRQSNYKARVEVKSLFFAADHRFNLIELKTKRLRCKRHLMGDFYQAAKKCLGDLYKKLLAYFLLADYREITECV